MTKQEERFDLMVAWLGVSLRLSSQPARLHNDYPDTDIVMVVIRPQSSFRSASFMQPPPTPIHSEAGSSSAPRMSVQLFGVTAGELGTSLCDIDHSTFSV